MKKHTCLPLLTCALLAALCLPQGYLLAAAPALPPVQLEDYTSPELKDRIAHGATTVIIPTGGTEQNGPHLAIGKHNWIVHHNAEAIARELGNVIVAPVIAFVPEGDINPPGGHMLYPGTISLSEEHYEALLEDTARSMKQAGFKLICFIGDHGGNQQGQKAVAEKLTAEWKSEGVTVLHVSDYYAPKAADDWANKYKQGNAAPGDHAGFEDASETMAVHPSGVRPHKIRAYTSDETPTTGVVGDPRGATADYGKKLLRFKIDAAMAQIRAALKKP